MAASFSETRETKEMVRSKKAPKKLLELGAQKRVVLQEIADANRRSAAARREEQELLAERAREERQSEIHMVLPDGGAGSTAVVTDPARVAAISKRIEELRTRGDRLQLRLTEIKAAEQQEVVAAIATAGRAIQDASAAHQKDRRKLGRAIKRDYRAAVASAEVLAEEYREFNRLKSRLQGDRKIVGGQKAVLGRLERDLREEDTSDDAIVGLIVERALDLSRRSTCGLEDYWREKGFPILPPPII